MKKGKFTENMGVSYMILRSSYQEVLRKKGRKKKEEIKKLQIFFFGNLELIISLLLFQKFWNHLRISFSYDSILIKIRFLKFALIFLFRSYLFGNPSQSEIKQFFEKSGFILSETIYTIKFPSQILYNKFLHLTNFH